MMEDQAGSSSRRGSKLIPFKEDIKKLEKNGYTLNQILEYLKLNDLEVGRTTLDYYIKKHIKLTK